PHDAHSLPTRRSSDLEFLPLDTLFDSASHAATPEGFLHVFPQIYDCEGFFVARLRKTRAVDPLPVPKFKVGNFPFAPVKGREARSEEHTSELQSRENL